ncbi:long-chain-fatty acid--ACP ligase MbtM [Nocardia aurantia]|uniref:Long-chain-fatty-acid--[acyl-carrier-protein] ligase MbtM n=1 Tax=Nocardia aurantia TaxID=2585199 RepID=A0A7K0DGH6_9NOCA|nr:long-chain-fatty acid--ACP ligase MbtM [Nocardia aurantia]MQY24920.1 Long-chain-fatty-acid--[acyl-carrier-protein] ligase MbtM [Nocardia aurantia]
MSTSTFAASNPLAAGISRVLSTSTADLRVLDQETGQWQRHPWPEIQAKAERIASEILARAGHEVGRVGLVGEPTPELVAAIQGAWLAGTTVSILPGPVRGADPAAWARTTLNRFAEIGVRTVFSHGTILRLLTGVETPLHVQDVAVAGRSGRSAAFTPQVSGDGGSLAVLQGTAGSTGTPKWVELSRDTAVANIDAVVDRLGLTAADVGCSWLPLYHDMGLTFLMSAFVTGIPLWLAPNSAFATGPFKWIDWMGEAGATYTAAPNFAYDIVGRYGRLLKNADLSPLRIAISGGEPIDCAGFGRFLAETSKLGFDPAAAVPAYGLAESTCAVTMTTPGDGLRIDEVEVEDRGDGTTTTRRYALLGEPIPGTEVRITPSAVRPQTVRGREVGDVEIRGTSMMEGYFGDERLPAERWFKTGDIGYLVDGALVVCGRAKELIIVAGRNIFPTEIERAAATVDGVRGGRVVAIGTGEGAARPGLAIAAEYKGADESSARAAIIERVASECGIVPSEVILVPAGGLPITTSGKLRRLEVKKLVESAGAVG